MKPDKPTSRPMLTSAARTLYQRLLAGETEQSTSPALTQLLDAQLAAPDPTRAGHYRALDATAAIREWQIALRLTATAALEEAKYVAGDMHDLVSAYNLVHPGVRGDGHEYVVGGEDINARLDVMISSCTTELLTAQPKGPRPAATLARSYTRDFDALSRGVTMRTLYAPAVRNDLPTARWAQAMTDQGASIRTSTQFGRAIVVDRRAAVIPVLTPWDGEGEPPIRALFIADEGIARVIASAFDRDWEHAEPWDGSMTGITIPDGHRDVLSCLSRGLEQDEIAAELNVSRRTVAGRIAELKTITGCRTTAQVMYWWATRMNRV